MLAELQAEDPVRFFYHLGDIVYLYGEEGNYFSQFFTPYAEYRAPIFAIPGQHDGDPAPDAGAPRWTRSRGISAPAPRRRTLTRRRETERR